MKNIYLFIVFAFTLLLSSCSSTFLSTKKVMDVQPGMTQAQVQKILGTPDLRRFDGNLEELEYHRLSSSMPYVTGNPTAIIVSFRNGLVESMSTYDMAPPPVAAPPVLMTPPVVIQDNQLTPEYIDVKVMSPAEFNRFFSSYKNEVFDSDRKKMLDEVISSFDLTCAQSARLVDLCDFDSEKKNLIKRLYPVLADKQNFGVLLNKFDFDMDKNELRSFANSYDRQHN